MPEQPRPGLRAVLGSDQALLRIELTRILEAGGITVVETVDNVLSLRRALTSPDVDVAVIEVGMARTARTARPGFPVLVLSQYVETRCARDLLASGEGSVGYLLYDRVADVDGFVSAVRQVAGGGTVLDPEVVAGLVNGSVMGRPLERLSTREREVLTRIAEGRSNAAIATRMLVSEQAIANHTTSIFAKLDLPQSGDDDQRVLTVLKWLQAQ